jgi:outer membrane receptor protein involved in Fe transport
LKRFGLLAVLLLVQFAFSQNATLSGVVLDTKGNPIPSVNVSISKKGKATSTDAEGKYSIPNLSNETIEVVATFVGFKTEKIQVNVNGNTSQNITMTDDTNMLEELVVTGVVNPRAKIKSSVSITTLDVKQVEQSAPRSTAEIFRTIPGIRSESSGGEGNANIAVRGVQFRLEDQNIYNYRKTVCQYYCLEIFLLQQPIFLQDSMVMLLR